MQGSRRRLLAILAAALAGVTLLGLWARHEARSQAAEVEEALRSQATALANTLGPALSSASAAARELDELLAWKLLDNARLLDRWRRGEPAELRSILDAHGLVAAIWFDPEGDLVASSGRTPRSAEIADGVAELLAADGDELVLGSLDGEEADLMAVAVRAADGGAVVAVTDIASAYAFSRQIGVSSLLTGMVETGAVLYLVYRESPGGWMVEASWDGDPAPPPSAEPIRRLRERSVFEVAVEVPAPADRTASLRVGLDGAPLERAAGAAMRRTTLVGAALAALGVAALAFALAARERDRERRESDRRLAAAEESRRRSERLAAAGSLAAGLAHEVRNPLNAIGLAAQQIERRRGQESRTGELAVRIHREVGRLDDSLRGFLELASPTGGERRDADLAELVADAIGLLSPEAAASGVELDTGEGTARARIDRDAVRGALVNLLRNAIQASPRGGRIEVDVEELSGVNGDGRVRILVRDDGGGIDPQLTERVFEPFVTGRAAGTGLGLAVVRRVVEEHGGRASLRNRASGGVEAAIELPRGGKR